ncbi:MAG TPA: zinc-dependent alcohol dehydrogenase family protein [Ferrovibrio sp.]|uniref:zinc-dependent alcohol dehydrogenase family protein n=1 Tax=Ferrovibrio sp. TaxID=1917215 RepID=UPI002ED2DD18
MVKAIQFSRFGVPHEVAELIELPDPGAPGEGEVILDMEAAAINPADLLQLEGRYGVERPQLPVIGGGEGVGIVREIGAGVAHLKPGDRVLMLFAGRGNWRSSVKAKAARLFPLLPADPLQLAMLTVNPATALAMLTGFVQLSPGDWVIQNAANSGVGHSLIVLAKQHGWRSLNVVRRPGLEAELKALGADAVLLDGPDLGARVHSITGQKAAPKLGIDAIGGEGTRRIGHALAEGGVIVNYGLLSGQPCMVDAAETVFRNVSLRGFWLVRWFASAAAQEIQKTYADLAAMVADGRIHVPVEATYPLSRYKEALAHAAREGRKGKILFTGGEA